MNKNLVIAKLAKIQNGSFFNMLYTSDVKFSAKARNDGVTVIKRTYGTFRTGVSYANTHNGKNIIASGKEIQPLPWGHYVDGFENKLIAHTNKAGQENIYLRVYTTPNKPKSIYLINGEVISKEDLMKTGYVVDSYWKGGHSDGVMNINITNIETIKQGNKI